MDDFVAHARLLHPQVQTGQFAADMQVHLVNDGPVTIPLRVIPSGVAINTGSSVSTDS